MLLVGPMPELGSNAVIGDGDVTSMKPREYFSSFDFDYSIGVILNIDEDHLTTLRISTISKTPLSTLPTVPA